MPRRDRMMRHTPATILAAFAVGVALTAFAQKAPPPPQLEPQVTIVRRENETIEEFRVNGRLTMVKVTPKHGRPYYLVADGASGGFVRRDSLDSGLRIPLWVLFSF